jgi:ribulose-5-phosphate 4-epimerase/fuculose-1-phosphate aldolase
MEQLTESPLAGPTFHAEEQITFAIAGETRSELVRWYVARLREALERQGHLPRPMQTLRIADALTDDNGLDLADQVRLVINQADLDRPRSIRRAGQGTFVVTIVEGRDDEAEVMSAAYPVLVRSLSNMVIFNTRAAGVLESHFITIEQGHYIVRQTGDERTFFDEVLGRIRPLACSHLIINNEFAPDLPPALWQGDDVTQQIGWAGRKLDQLGLLPSVVPIDRLLSERDLRHVKRLYNMGGLSYGNLSGRALHDPSCFWMSASGVDKSRLETVGRDILLVTGYDPARLLMRLSVPANVEPRRVSVDAIEHWMIYREHPDVGAIVHVHGWWRDPIPSTQVNYPCGTYELAAEVAELVRQAPDPSRAVIGLKNHGLTITGHSIREIFERVEGMIVPQVPMS